MVVVAVKHWTRTSFSPSRTRFQSSEPHWNCSSSVGVYTAIETTHKIYLPLNASSSVQSDVSTISNKSALHCLTHAMSQFPNRHHTHHLPLHCQNEHQPTEGVEGFARPVIEFEKQPLLNLEHCSFKQSKHISGTVPLVRVEMRDKATMRDKR